MIDFIGLVFCSLFFVALCLGILILFASESFPIWLSVVIAGLLLILFVVITVSVSKDGLEKVAKGIWLSLIKIAGYLYKKTLRFYKIITFKFLPIQKKLFSISLISGIVFSMFDIFAWLEFLNADDYGYGRGWYLKYNFIFPNPTMFDNSLIVSRVQDYYWYSDKVLFTGIIFLISSLLLLISFVVSSSIIKRKNEK